MNTCLGTPPIDHASAIAVDSDATTLQEYRSQYERLCKEFLGQKQMLVPLLQGTIPEFLKLSSDVVLACLGNEPAIDKISMDLDDFIAGKCSPDTETFSIFLETKSPDPKLCPKDLLIGIEVQNTFAIDNSFGETQRALFYTEAIHDTQIPSFGEFNNDFISKANPARSVWIYLNPPPAERNVTYVFKANTRIIATGKDPAKPATEPPLLDPIGYSFAYLGGPVNEDYHGLYELLHVVFVANYTVEQKCDILEHKFGFTLTTELTQGLQNMFAFSQKIVAKSLSQGRQETLEQLKAVKEQIRSGKSVDESLQTCNIPEAEQASFRDLLS